MVRTTILSLLIMVTYTITATAQERMSLEIKKADTTKKIIRNIVWISSCKANTVRGVSFGLQTINHNSDHIHVEGVNINADILSGFLTIYGLTKLFSGNDIAPMVPYVDEPKNRITGLSLSAGGIYGENYFSLRGVSINGGICVVSKAYGVVITGTQNVIDEFNGLTISVLRNLSIIGRGVQISLFNICKDFKGIQIGLWNVNSKRRLPIINWNF